MTNRSSLLLHRVAIGLLIIVTLLLAGEYCNLSFRLYYRLCGPSGYQQENDRLRAENADLKGTLEGIRLSGKSREEMIEEGSIRPGSAHVYTGEFNW